MSCHSRISAFCLIIAFAHTCLHGDEAGFHIYELPGYADLPQIPGTEFTVHQADRPQPKRILIPDTKPLPSSPAPADAIVLFDGGSLDQFRDNLWSVVDGNIIAGEESLVTKKAFGDFQMHIEWKTPEDPSIAENPGQMGNSGIYIMQRYELQIYDSYSSKIYADGSAGAIYGQSPPLVNACRKPGKWQSFDIAFKAPIFENEELIEPARITVFHNGVLIQNNTEILGPTLHKDFQAYKAHPEKEPIALQGHSSPVAFRNIWIREI